MSAPISKAAPGGQSFKDAVDAAELGNITAPDDSQQVETNLFPTNVDAMHPPLGESGDVGP
jgi:hypothetical protein